MQYQAYIVKTKKNLNSSLHCDQFSSGVKARFAGTSTDELMRVMDVGRQSMYDTFGDKRALFLRALETYVNESVNSIRDALEAPGPALAAIQNVLVSFAERKDLSSAEGCMGINAVCEFGQRDTEVNQIAWKAERRQRETLMNVLTRAKSRGELSDAVDVNAWRISSRARLPESELRQRAARAGKHCGT